LELLEDTDMKHVVQPGTLGQGEAYSDLIDHFDDAVRTVEPGT
jgi:hypothetical protein